MLTPPLGGADVGMPWHPKFGLPDPHLRTWRRSTAPNHPKGDTATNHQQPEPAMLFSGHCPAVLNSVKGHRFASVLADDPSVRP